MDSLLTVLLGGFSTSFIIAILVLLVCCLFLILIVTIICSIISKYVVSTAKEIMDYKADIQIAKKQNNIKIDDETKEDDENDEDYLNYE